MSLSVSNQDSSYSNFSWISRNYQRIYGYADLYRYPIGISILEECWRELPSFGKLCWRHFLWSNPVFLHVGCRVSSASWKCYARKAPACARSQSDCGLIARRSSSVSETLRRASMKPRSNSGSILKKKLSEKESQTELYYFSHLIFDSICHIAFILSSISFLSIFVGYI